MRTACIHQKVDKKKRKPQNQQNVDKKMIDHYWETLLIKDRQQSGHFRTSRIPKLIKSVRKKSGKIQEDPQEK